MFKLIFLNNHCFYYIHITQVSDTGPMNGLFCSWKCRIYYNWTAGSEIKWARMKNTSGVAVQIVYKVSF